MENTYQKGRKGGKLEEAFIGPYTIYKSFGKGIYQLKNENGKILKRKINIGRLKVYKKRKHDERDDTDETINEEENEKKPESCKKRKHDEIEYADKTDEEENEKKPENVGQSGNLKVCKKRKHDVIDDTDKTDKEEKNEKKPENVGHNGNLKACMKKKHDESDLDNNKICDGKNNCNRRNMGQTDIKTRGKCKYCFVTLHNLFWCIIVGIAKVSTRKMRENIITGQWLDSDHMRLAQQLLQDEHPHLDGFQSTLLSQNDGFCPVKGESVQIHHIDSNHWVTSSSIGNEVAIYDSRYSGGELSSSLTHQLAIIYRTWSEETEEVEIER